MPFSLIIITITITFDHSILSKKYSGLTIDYGKYSKLTVDFILIGSVDEDSCTWYSGVSPP